MALTTSSATGVSRKTLLAVAAVSAAGAAVAVAAYAKGRKKKRQSRASAGGDDDGGDDAADFVACKDSREDDSMEIAARKTPVSVGAEGDATPSTVTKGTATPPNIGMASSTPPSSSDKQCNNSWSEEMEAVEERKPVADNVDNEEVEEKKLSMKLGELKVSSMSQDAPAKVTDSGVASPVGDGGFVSKKQRSESSDSGGSSNSSMGSLHNNPNLTQDGAFSDSGQGSEPDDGTIMCYQFKIPSHITGMLIGAKGQFVNSLKATSMCHIDIEKNFNRDSRRGQKNNWKPPQAGEPQEYQTVMLEGTRSQIDKCLDLIRARFCNNPEVNLEQINSQSGGAGLADQVFATPQHALASGSVLPVFISALESGTHIFVQQPTHFTFHLIPRLEECMNHVYNSEELAADCALSASELVPSLVCVCKAEGKWYRIQLLSSEAEENSGGEEDRWGCRFVDVGGYGWVKPSDLRKIRSDFLQLPFQAIECCLSNVIPRESVDEFTGAEALRDLTQNKNCFVRLSHIEEAGVPHVDLYYQADDTEDSRHLLVNRELVNLGLMDWFESSAVPAAPV